MTERTINQAGQLSQTSQPNQTGQLSQTAGQASPVNQPSQASQPPIAPDPSVQVPIRSADSTSDDSGLSGEGGGLRKAESIHLNRSYATLKSADSLAHLAEQLTGEAERFERETGLRLATVRVTRDKEAGTLKLLKVTVG